MEDWKRHGLRTGFLLASIAIIPRFSRNSEILLGKKTGAMDDQKYSRPIFVFITKITSTEAENQPRK